MTTYLDRLWDAHVVTRLEGGVDLLHVDRHLLHDVTSPQAFSGLRLAGRRVRNPELTFAVADHIVSTEPGRTGSTVPGGSEMVQALRGSAAEFGVRLFDVGQLEQGIIHIVAAEQGLALPGTLVVATDSHACTVGALGALAWGLGTSESEHVLATQTIRARRPKMMRVTFDGLPGPAVSAKDLILHLIGRIGTRGGTGHAIEFDGAAIRAMPIEGRLTLCNMTIEAGSAIGVVRPDDATFAYLHGRPSSPKGAAWDQAVAYWRALAAKADGPFAKEVTIDTAEIAPQVTWGISPHQVIGVDGRVPEPAGAGDRRALDYMGLTPGAPIEGLTIDRVFIGSCTNARLSDLQAAAAVVRGRRVAEGVTALVVPGSGMIKQAAEAEGLDRLFRDAGFQWREPGCSMCAGVNGDLVGPRERCVATSNRNFEGRQGPLARTHLASPIMAAAAAVTGRITDVRKLGAA